MFQKISAGRRLNGVEVWVYSGSGPEIRFVEHRGWGLVIVYQLLFEDSWIFGWSGCSSYYSTT